ncbi:MAG: LPXTG cell wall anchor domain-containing protein, partial [Ruminiclostridium sp.]|nr:LPXTG cell wall anchor domain-containing protein [Ruminiclostridium sp.]
SPEEGKPATDYGVDAEAIAQIRVRFTTDDPDFFEGAFGGSVITSCNGGTMTEDEVAQHNWPSNEWWGIVDDELEIATQDDTKRCVTEKVGDLTYEIVCNIEQGYNNLYNTAGCVQIGVQEWGADMSQLVVLEVSCLDASGNTLISFDGKGVATVGGAAASAPAQTEAAPAATEAAAPAAGDVAAATNSSKGSPDTGIEDVAVVAGLAIVAGGAVLVSKKRK